MDKSREKTAITRLAEAVQRRLRANIRSRVTGQAGPDHAPKIFVEIQLPGGSIYSGSGRNQREARQKAAIKALAAISQGKWEK